MPLPSLGHTLNSLPKSLEPHPGSKEPLQGALSVWVVMGLLMLEEGGASLTGLWGGVQWEEKGVGLGAKLASPVLLCPD